MKKISTRRNVLSLGIIIMFLSISGVIPQGYAEEDTSVFTVARMVIAGSIEEREPVGVVNAFSVSTEKVYCFLEAKDIKEDTTVTFVWYHEDKKMAAVALPLQQGSRWRTNSSKKLAGLKGNWKVELRDASENILKTVEFTVE